MMSLRNLVLVTLLAAASAGNFQAGNSRSSFHKNKYSFRAYYKCANVHKMTKTKPARGESQDLAVHAWFDKGWYDQVRADAADSSNDGQSFRDCRSTPATCVLTTYKDSLNQKQETCMKNIAIAECARANHLTSGLGFSKTTSDRAKAEFISRMVDGAVAKGGCNDVYEPVRYGPAALRAQAYRKTIDTAAKGSQKTTGSSDNTVLIVVVALLAVFALAVGVWVGRLSSEMKIPQDAQMGPVGIETV